MEENNNTIILTGEWLRASHAAARLGVTTTRFHEMVRAGRLGYQQLPTGRVYSAEQVDALRVKLEAWPGHQRTPQQDAATEAAGDGTA